MALHSSSPALGVATVDLNSPDTTINSSSFPVGRSLSNNFLTCIEDVLPASSWPQICRIAVAIGPGGFTGTRLTVVIARTLAQQLNCPLDGISSFALMAPRLTNQLSPNQKHQPFWIIKEQPRRGLIGGKYQINSFSNNIENAEVLELEEPHLISEEVLIEPAIKASDNVDSDVVQLLNTSLIAHQREQKSQWTKVLPLYPTSPIKNTK